MNNLSGYLLLAVSCGVIAGVASHLSHPSLAESVEWVAGLFLLLSLVGPLLGLITSLPPEIALPDAEEMGEGEYVEVIRQALESGIEKELADSFSLDDADVRVECCELILPDMRAEVIEVVLTCTPREANLTRIRDHVLENYVTDGGKCDVRWLYE